MDASVISSEQSCSIDRLVDDILRIVFDMVIIPPIYFCPPIRRQCSSVIVLRLMLVCRRWKDILSSSGYTWSHISTSSKAVAEAFLERSQNVGLDVQLERHDMVPLDVLLDQGFRFRQFHLFGRMHFKTAIDGNTPHRLSSFFAPSLQSLTFDFLIVGGQTLRIFNVNSTRFPNLRKLSLCDVYAPNLGFTRLTHICVQARFSDINDLVSMIQSNLALEELILHNSHFDPDECMRTLPRSTVIELPHLRWISLRYMTTFLEHIRIMSSQCSVRLESSAYISPFYPFSPPLVKLGIDGLHEFSFTAWNDNNHVRSSIPSHADWVDRSGITKTRTFSSILEETAEDRGLFAVQELWLSGCHTSHRVSDCKWVPLGCMRSLTRIFVVQGSYDFIVKPLTPEDDVDDVVCPDLEELSLLMCSHISSSFNNLFRMIEQREERGFRLRRLHIYLRGNMDMDEDVIEWLEQHVDEVSVITKVVGEHNTPRMDIPRQFMEPRHDNWGGLRYWTG